MRCSKHPSALPAYASKFRYVLVDEYQDTNPPQYMLVKRLAEVHRNLCVVGDHDQSIYRWRGADLRNILDFEHDFPDAMIVKLEQNYRSTQVILEAANAVISRNRNRKDKRLWTDKEGGASIVLYQAGDEIEEADFITRGVRETQHRRLTSPTHFTTRARRASSTACSTPSPRSHGRPESGYSPFPAAQVGLKLVRAFMDELALIDRLRLIATDPAARGLADDVAVIGDLVLTHDMIAEGVHFLPIDPPASVGWKLVTVNLSDLAAKGAEPVAALMGFTIGQRQRMGGADSSTGVEAACEAYGAGAGRRRHDRAAGRRAAGARPDRGRPPRRVTSRRGQAAGRATHCGWSASLGDAAAGPRAPAGRRRGGGAAGRGLSPARAAARRRPAACARTQRR